MRFRDCEVMDVSATPIVSAKTGSHEPAFLEGDMAASAIPAQKRLEVLRLVRRAQADVLGGPPQI